MSHVFSTRALSILRDLLVLDRYRRASDRPEGDEFIAEEGRVCLFELLLHRFLEGFLSLDEEMARAGDTPFALHLETGDGASRFVPSGFMAAASGSPSVLSVPESMERFALPHWSHLLLLPLTLVQGQVRASLIDMNLRPAVPEGDVRIRWQPTPPALQLSLDFEVSGVEIHGEADIVGRFRVDLTHLDAGILLKPDIKAQRLVWELEVTADAKVGNSPLFVDGRALAKRIEDHFVRTLEALLADHVPVLAGALGALPLRPVEDAPPILADDGLQAGFQLLGLEVPARLSDSDRTQLSALFVLDALNPSLYEATLLPCNPRHLLPTSQQVIAHADDAEAYARSHAEAAHLANRTDSFSTLEISGGEEGEGLDLIVDHAPLPGVPDAPGIECMRYLVALDAVTFENPEAAGTAHVEAGLSVWHPLLAADPTTVGADELLELARLEGNPPIALSAAVLGAEAVCFLEWGGKLRLEGKVEAGVLGGSIEFVHDIDIERGPMLSLVAFSPSDKLTVHCRLQQLPYAQAYEWVSVTFSRVDIEPGAWASLPAGAVLVLEAYVNGSPDDGAVPFRRRRVSPVIASVALDGWSRDVIYREDDVAAEISFELHAFFVDPLDGHELRRLVASRVVHRFANEDGDAVTGDSLAEAAENDAVAEWGIPAGLPAAALVMADGTGQLEVTVVLRNQRFRAADVPPRFQAKTFDIAFPSVRVDNDTDHGLSGEGELRFSCSVQRRPAGQAEALEVWSGRTRTLRAQDPVDLELPGPPVARGVNARPEDELVLRVNGLDFDWPPFDPHDRMGVAEITLTVPRGDGLDQREVGLHTGRSDTGDFVARAALTTTSTPPSPALWIDAGNGEEDRDLTEIDVLAGTTVTLAYDGVVEWATSGRLARSGNEDDWEEEAPLDVDDPADTFEVSPAATMRYRLEASNVAGTARSRVLTVRVV